MFLTLKYKVKFPPTHRFPEGQELSGDRVFQQGLTAISGPNESGKSMNLEMARYLLFGAKALRGKADDYKNLKVEGRVCIRGEEYEIFRTKTKSFVKRGSKEIAVGTKAVNLKIVELLGFSLAVFDTANSVNQGEVGKLGNMTPKERQQLIDSVVGLDVLDRIGKWAGGESQILRAELRGLQAGHVEPEAPIKPENYTSSKTLEPKLVEKRKLEKELNQIQGWLDNERSEPKKPEDCNIVQTVEQLTDKSQEYRSLKAEIQTQKTLLLELPTSAAFDLGQLDKFELDIRAYDEEQDKLAWLRRNPKPKYFGRDDVLQQVRKDHELLNLFVSRDQTAFKVQNLKAEGHIDCSSCGTRNYLQKDLLDSAQRDLDRLDESLLGKTAPEVPELSPNEVEREMEANLEFSLVQVEWEQNQVPKPIGRPELSMADVEKHRSRYSKFKQRERVDASLDELTLKLAAMPNYDDLLLRRQVYEGAVKQYSKELTSFESWKKERVLKKSRERQLIGIEDQVLDLEDQIEVSRSYERELISFNKDKQNFDRIQQEIDSKNYRMQQYQKIKSAMVTLKTKVKQHLLPSLNTVASRLVAAMTAGERRQIVVDDDFDVSVDGQHLSTLSGSGKSVSNLAIRLALGQVLTNNVFSCFLADEIDADMDAVRAKETSKLMSTLTNNISQIILVSHKVVEAKNRIITGEYIDDSIAEAS